MLKSNSHTHTVFCDGKNTAREMINRAIDVGFTSLGFSFHSPLPYENDYAIAANKVDEYYSEIEQLKSEYQNKIEIFNGIELDFDSINNINTDKFDYIIGSVHQIYANNQVYYLDYTANELQRCVDECFDKNWNKMAKHYYDLILDFATKKQFDIVGHFDLITKFNEDFSQFDELNEEYQQIAKNCLDKLYLINPNLIFEVNTGAMFRLNNTNPYPNKQLLKHINTLGFKVMINSDSHSINSLDFAFDRAIDLCKSCDITSVQILADGGFDTVLI